MAFEVDQVQKLEDQESDEDVLNEAVMKKVYCLTSHLLKYLKDTKTLQKEDGLDLKHAMEELKLSEEEEEDLLPLKPSEKPTEPKLKISLGENDSVSMELPEQVEAVRILQSNDLAKEKTLKPKNVQDTKDVFSVESKQKVENLSELKVPKRDL